MTWNDLYDYISKMNEEKREKEIFLYNCTDGEESSIETTEILDKNGWVPYLCVNYEEMYNETKT